MQTALNKCGETQVTNRKKEIKIGWRPVGKKNWWEGQGEKDRTIGENMVKYIMYLYKELVDE